MKHHILIFFLGLFSVSVSFSQQDTLPLETDIFYQMPSYIETGSVFFRHMPDTFRYLPDYKSGDIISDEMNFVKAGLLQTKISYYLKRKDKNSFFKEFSNYVEMNKQMKFPIDPSLELRLKKNWSNKDSVFAILSEIEFVRTSLIEENMNQPGKKNTLLLQFSNLIETGIAFYQFAKTKPSKAQRMQWDDLKLNFENFYSAMKVYENESEKIKTILAAPRIAYDDTTAKTPVTVTEKNGVMLIEGGAPIEDEGGKQKLPTDTEIKLTYEKLLGYRKILLN